ncbi:hypothetical protein ACQWF9_24755, partial [Salmonella enterica subsp. enterica serovar Infantis]
GGFFLGGCRGGFFGGLSNIVFIFGFFLRWVGGGEVVGGYGVIFFLAPWGACEMYSFSNICASLIFFSGGFWVGLAGSMLFAFFFFYLFLVFLFIVVFKS